MNHLPTTIMLLVLASAVVAQDTESRWDRAFHDGLADRATVLELIRSAGESDDPEALRFLRARARGWPRGAFARDALEALGRNEKAGFVAFVVGLADRARKDADKIAALEFLERSPAHRTRALATVIEMAARHRGDPFGRGLIGILERYLARPLDPAARARILELLLDVWSDDDERFCADAAWEVAGGARPAERVPFLVVALERIDERHAREAADALIEGRVQGADDLVVDCLVRRPDDSARAKLWDVLSSDGRDLLWIKVLERAAEIDWTAIGRVRELLRSCTAAPVRPQLMGALQRLEEPKIVALALQWMRDHHVVSAMPQIRAALLESTDPRIKILAAETMSELSGDETWWRRARRYIETSDETARLDRIDALIETRLESPRVRGWLRARLGRHERWEITAHLIQAAGVAGFGDVTALVDRFLEHRRWQVRLAVIECLVESGQRRALPRLAALAGDERYRLARAAADGLHRLTGQRFGTNPDGWRRYISRLPGDWTARRLPSAETSDARDVRYGPTFYGLDLRSNMVVFVCDLSGSMAGPKLEALKHELVRAVDTIDEPGGFNVVFFSTDVRPVWPQLALGVPRMKKKVAARIAQAMAVGGTNLWGALELALHDREADTIVVLTDGQPSEGRYQAPADVLRETRRLNRTRRMQIHTLFVPTPDDPTYPFPRVINGVDEAGAKRFLEHLAERNGGLHKLAGD